MFGALLTLLFISCSLAHGQNLSVSTDSVKNGQNVSVYTSSVGRIPPILQRLSGYSSLTNLIGIVNSQCPCYTRTSCAAQGGIPFGNCNGYAGVCCIIQKSCGSLTRVNNTFFTNEDYPLTSDGTERCSITVQKMNANICQLRLDFLDFNIAQPTTNGDCQNDFFAVTGGSSRTPRICGENTDQHMYVNFDGSNPISLFIHANSEIAMRRRWNIMIQQIYCNSEIQVPTGCLQYYTAVAGTVSSFNYGIPSSGTREMTNLNYGVCIRPASGYCGVRWSEIEDKSFSVTGDGGAATQTSLSGADCKTDYVVVPNAKEINSLTSTAERFCGTKFTTKITNSMPFALYVVTDASETSTGVTPAVTDTLNRGFSLAYKQMICSY